MRPPAVLALFVLVAALAAVEHPFILWTPAEAAAIRARLAQDPDAQAQLVAMRESSAARDNPTVWNLFRYAVLQEEEAGQRELAALRGFIGRRPDPLTWDVDPKTLKWNVGMPSSGDSHMRDEQTLQTLRYDTLYHLLTAQERTGVEAALRSYIDFHLDGHQPWHPSFRYDRTSWLPNMHWPRAIGTHLMAAALGEEDLVRRMHESQGGLRWFLDEYLADGRFYMEEFGKYYSNIGTLLLYCEALEKLGWPQYGYGCTGAGGGTVRRFLGMMMDIGLPRLAPPAGATPRYPRVTMGDAGNLHVLINGRGWPDEKGRGSGPDPFWRESRMNGPLPKMQLPGWFEIGHRRWPDAGFGYFLAQMRGLEETRYLPSLYWNLAPIDPAAVAPPPAPSYSSRGRGFALLRAEEGPAYWESPAPAVALQFGMYYVHYVHDCFSILQFVAHNRLLYGSMGRPAGRKGYAGGDDWKDHVRGHCGVVVDGAQAQPVDRGNAGCENQRIRADLTGPARHVAVRATGIYPGVDQERLLVLTREYLLDVTRLVATGPRTYDWQVLVHGSTADRGGPRWTPLAAWSGRDAKRPHLVDTRVLDAGDGAWQADVLLPDEGASIGVGVTVRMLGAPGTLVLDSVPPGCEAATATSLLVTRYAPATAFTALHAPFAGGADHGPVAAIERLAEDDVSLAVRITGPGLDDRVYLAWGEGPDQPRTVAAGGAVATFAGFALVRSGPERILVQGGLTALDLPVAGLPALAVDGAPATAAVADGRLRWSR
jgi:hypothetical protein